MSLRKGAAPNWPVKCENGKEWVCRPSFCFIGLCVSLGDLSDTPSISLLSVLRQGVLDFLRVPRLERRVMSPVVESERERERERE